MFSIVLSVGGAEPANPSARLMYLLGQSLNAASAALSAAQYVPLDDAAIDHAVVQLHRGVTAARAAARTCEDELFPAEVRASTAHHRTTYGHRYRAFMHAYAKLVGRYRDEFAAQRKLEPAHRTKVRLEALNYALKELVRRAHRDLKTLAKTP